MDEKFTVAEAAIYCGIPARSIYLTLDAAPEEHQLWETKEIIHQGRVVAVKAVSKSTLDAFRARGFLTPGKIGRRRNGNTRASVSVALSGTAR